MTCVSLLQCVFLLPLLQRGSISFDPICFEVLWFVCGLLSSPLSGSLSGPLSGLLNLITSGTRRRRHQKSPILQNLMLLVVPSASAHLPGARRRHQKSPILQNLMLLVVPSASAHLSGAGREHQKSPILQNLMLFTLPSASAHLPGAGREHQNSPIWQNLMLLVVLSASTHLPGAGKPHQERLHQGKSHQEKPLKFLMNAQTNLDLLRNNPNNRNGWIRCLHSDYPVESNHLWNKGPAFRRKP